MTALVSDTGPLNTPQNGEVVRFYERLKSVFPTPYATFEELQHSLISASLSNDTPIISAALRQAQKSHGDQRRDDGKPYLEAHIYPAAISGINHEMQSGRRVPAKFVAAILCHDCPEDDPEMPLPVFREEFGKPVGQKPIKPGRSVADLVEPLTKGKPADFPGDTPQQRRDARDAAYHQGLEDAQFETKVAKLADRENNIYSLHGCPLDKVLKKLEETVDDYLPMAREISPEIYHPSIIRRIGELLDFIESQDNSVIVAAAGDEAPQALKRIRQKLEIHQSGVN